MMKVLIGNGGWLFGYLAASFRGRLGWLMTPNWVRYPDYRIPYAYDNGAYGAFLKQKPFDDEAFYKGFVKLFRNGSMPRWIAVPDVVCNRSLTIDNWYRYYPLLSELGCPLFFVVQDGMDVNDVPEGADGVFIGGSTDWKWETAGYWCKKFKRVHIGRVNTYRMLWLSHEAGAESCDGSGWFRGDQEQIRGLERYLTESNIL